MKNTNHYVDNEELLENIKVWQKQRAVNPDTPLPNSIGKAILEIAHNLATKRNFNRYTEDWLESMIGDAIIAAVKGVKNFDPEKYSNPHAYISTVCFRAFKNRIKKEQKKSVARYKYFVAEVFDSVDEEMSGSIDIMFYQDMLRKVSGFEEKERARKERALAASLEKQKPEDQPLTGLELIYGRGNF